jgi:hypothetical protein
MQPARVVEILQDGASVGTGYLIGPRHVLTARHVITPERKDVACEVHPLEAAGSAATPLGRLRRPQAMDARVGWMSRKHDLAVIEIAGGKSIRGIPAGTVTLGCVPRDADPLPCIGRGFPKAAGADERVVRGRLSWVRPEWRFDMDVENTPPANWEDWAGFSGTAVFVGDSLVGVIRTVDGHWSGGKLEATPVEYLQEEKALVRYFAHARQEVVYVSLPRRQEPRIVRGLVAQAHLEDLLHALPEGTLPGDLLTEIYRNCLPPTAAVRGDRSVRGIVTHLAEMPMPRDEKPLPLFRFVRDLADRHPGARARLESWLQTMEQAYPELPRVALDAPPRSHRYFVAVILDADAVMVEGGSGIGRIASIRVWKEGETQPLQGGWDPDRPVTLAEVHAELVRQLDTLQEQLAQRSAGRGATEIIVEFCLPHALLAEPVDEWPVIDAWETPQPLGAAYPVVLRDRERRAGNLLDQRWLERWSRLEQHPPLSIEQLYWLEEGEGDARALFDMLVRPVVADPHVCIGLCFTVAEDWLRRQPRQDFLSAAWLAGLPAAIWFRTSPGGPVDVKRLFGDLMKGALIHELPRRLWELRRGAGDDSRTRNRRIDISLVWDDPKRIPYQRRIATGGGQ